MNQESAGWRKRHAQGLLTFLPFRLTRYTSSKHYYTHTSIFGQKGGGKEKFASQRCRLHLLPHRWLDQLHNVESLQGKKCLLLIFANFPFTAKVGLLPTDLFDITGPDDAGRNAKRFERIWEEEKQRCKNSSQKPSLSRSFGL